jgi:cytochrome c oxidase subunit 1
MTAVARPEARPVGILRWAAGTDHKRIGVLTGLTALGFFLTAGVFALLMRLELSAPGMQILSRDSYNELFTAHGSDMVYLVITPFAIALGVYFVPLQVGAAEIAAPRLCLIGYWLYLFGGLTIYSGFLTSGGAGRAGWTAFYPLSDTINTPGTGMDLWIFGVILATGGMAIQAGCILATLLTLRAPGMTMLRLPVFSWAMVLTTLMVVTAFPVVVTAMGLLEADRLGADVFASSGGPATYQHLFWFYGHPVVYVMFFPFVGAAGEVVAVFARRRFFGYHAMAISLIVFAALSMSVWAHHMFATGQVQNEYFSLTSTALLVPAGIEYFDLIATMIGGAILLRTPMLFAVAFVLQFLVGGLSGIFTASPPLDYHVHDSFFVVAHFHYTLFAGSLFAFFAAVYYWFPKVTGALLREGLGKLHFALLVIGTNLTFFPMFILGYEGMPRRIADYSPESGFEGLNKVATAGAFTIALAIAVFLANLVVSLRRREPAGDDPWGGHTLEWATSSPPPRFNFGSLPEIRSYAPLLDRAALEEARK